MATSFHRNELSSKDLGTERPSPVSAIATLLGVYTALYLAVVGVLHFATAPDAAAAVVPSVPSAHVTETLSSPADGGAVATPSLLEPDAAEEENSRECTGGIDMSCIYN